MSKVEFRKDGLSKDELSKNWIRQNGLSKDGLSKDELSKDWMRQNGLSKDGFE